MFQNNKQTRATTPCRAMVSIHRRGFKAPRSTCCGRLACELIILINSFIVRVVEPGQCPAKGRIVLFVLNT